MMSSEPMPDGFDPETWCHIHFRAEEDDGAYQVCIECGHVFPTARDLRRDFRKMVWQYAKVTPLWSMLWLLISVRASKLASCPHCTHDFMAFPLR